MNNTMKGLIIFLCVFTFMATMSMDALAQRGSKPIIMQGPQQYDCNPAERICQCKNAEDCLALGRSGECTGTPVCRHSGGKEVCSCYQKPEKPIPLVPLNRRSMRGFQK